MAQNARDRGTVGRELAAHAGRLQAAIERTVAGPLASHGLTRADFDVLAALATAAEGDGDSSLRPKELSSRLLLTTGGLSNVLRRLEADGLITRAGSSTDGRGQSVRITPDGLRLIVSADEAVADVISRFLAPVDFVTLSSGLRALHTTLVALGEDEPVHQFLSGRRSASRGEA